MPIGLEKYSLRLCFFTAALLLLGGCSGADILNSLVPHSGYSLRKDIAYGALPRQRLDIYTPDKLTGPVPVILFFYGGSWQEGDRKDYRFLGQAFTSRGYIAVVADYRLYPEVHFPAFLEDGAKALAWVHAHIGQYGGDGDRLFVAGHSAGAYIAVMLTAKDSYIKAEGGKRDWIKGTIGIAGPYDFLPFTDPAVKALFSTAKDADTQPINWVGAGLPPMLLVTGDEDTKVRPENSARLAARLRRFHDPVTVRTYPGVAHIGIMLSLADGFRSKAPLLDDIDAFLREPESTK